MSVTRLARLVSLTLVCAAAAAHAGGLEYPENGAQALGRGGAFVAKADDASAWWNNPAGLAKLAGYQLYLSGNLSFAKQSFDRSGKYPTTIGGPAYEGQDYPKVESSNFFPAPMGAFTAGIGDKLTLSLAVGGPSAIGAKEYPSEVTVNGVTAPAPQRYDLIKAETLVFFPTISAAYRISPKLDVGAGFMWGIGLFKNRSVAWGTRNPEEDPGNDSVVDLEADDKFIPTFNVGVLYRPSPKLEVGGMFRMGAKVHAFGEVKADFGANLEAVTKLRPQSPCKIDETAKPDTACTDISTELPPVLRAGARYIMRDGWGREKGDVELDVSLELWNVFDAYEVHTDGNTPIEIEDQRVEHQYKNTFGVRLGGSYLLGPVNARAGVAFDTAASPDAYSRLDGDSWAKLTGGAGGSFTTRGVTFDLSAAFVQNFAPTVGAGKGKVNPLLPVESYPPPPPALNVVNEGKFAASAFVLGVGLRFSFAELGGARSGTSIRNPYLSPEASLPGVFGGGTTAPPDDGVAPADGTAPPDDTAPPDGTTPPDDGGAAPDGGGTPESDHAVARVESFSRMVR